MQHFDQLVGYNDNNIAMPCSSSSVLNNHVDSKEGEHMSLVSTNLLQDSIEKDHVPYD